MQVFFYNLTMWLHSNAGNTLVWEIINIKAAYLCRRTFNTMIRQRYSQHRLIVHFEIWIIGVYCEMSRAAGANDQLSLTIANLVWAANVTCPNSSGKERRNGRRSVAWLLLSATGTCADSFSPFLEGRLPVCARARTRHEFADHVSAQNLVGFSTCHFSEVPAWWDL